MYYSQFGEDEILEWLFADRATGVAVEVGANDGVHGSTTLTFEKKGWQCILVEPTPQLVEAIRASRGFVQIETNEVLLRGWHIQGQAVRPEHDELH